MILIPAGNASEWTGPTGNNTYLLPGRVPALIDAGVGRDEHIAAIARALEDRQLALVLITHGHTDHVAGIPALRARWPAVAVRGLQADDPVRPGEVIEAGSGALTAIWTPGHSPDHCCYYDVETRDLYCGDLIRAGGTIVIPASRGGDLRQYLESLRHVRELRPARLLPGHGPVVDDPAALIDAYIEHRGRRDREILDALGAGRRTPEEIVAHVYGALPVALEFAARETVVAHLIKLESEGRAARTGTGWVQAG